MRIWRSPMSSRSVTARSERPIRRWISWVRPVCLPRAASRSVRLWVARGSMPYSAVIQPLRWSRSQAGTRSSRLAVQITWVSPNLTRQEPSAWRMTPSSKLTCLSWSLVRPDGRMMPFLSCILRLAPYLPRPGRRVHTKGVAALIFALPRPASFIDAPDGRYYIAGNEFVHARRRAMRLEELSTRSRDIFRQIVETYLETGDPVGSRTVSRLPNVGLSPASVRNVMADLEEAGLLSAPHTSAGRVPTALGLRMFVDGLLEVGDLSAAERQNIEAQCRAAGRRMEDVLGEATKALSGLSHCAGLVSVQKASHAPLRHIEFVHLSPGRALVVLVNSDGVVENRLMDVPLGLPPSALIQAANYLNARING